jgi:hypothetical protein
MTLSVPWAKLVYRTACDIIRGNLGDAEQMNEPYQSDSFPIRAF